MKLLAIVTLFYPDENKIEKNINSYLGAVDELLVWNNTPGGRITLPYNHKIKIIGENENVGLGRPLNKAIEYANANKFTHLLTMDQDSYFEDEDGMEYVDIIRKAKQKAIFSPNYVLHNKAFYDRQAYRQDSFIDVETTMTSGTVYPLSVFDEIGIFREDFFIDSIDSEFSLRAGQNGIPTKIIPSAHLIHGAGYQKKKYKFLWKTFFPNEYSPVRSYYIIRNGLLTKRLYPQAKRWKGYFYYWFYKRLFFVLCYEDNKYAKFKGLFLGYLHGKQGKTGRQTIFDEKNIYTILGG
jgi:rhamnosyltransferase